MPANRVELSVKDRDLIGSGLNNWQKLNKIELGLEGAAVAAGVILTAPWLTAAGVAFGTGNLIQMGVIHEAQKSREKKGNKVGPIQMKQGTEYAIAA